DQGIGIPPDQASRIFDMFTRINSGGAAPPGLGIGLALSRRLVGLHGGSVEIIRTPTGQGSKFEIRLPLALPPAGPAAPPRAPVAEKLAKARPRILVVDDNVDAADALTEALQLSGFTASVAYSGEQALVQFAEVRPSAVLLDIGLPDLSGIEVARRLR